MIHSPLRPEIQILLCSSHIEADSTVADARVAHLKTLLQHPICWDELVELAQRHHMLPLLHHTLSTTCQELIPSSVLAQLRDRAAHMAMLNFSRTRQLLGLLDVLHRHHIDAISFKGPTLTALLYDNLAFRQFGDLDVLVHPQDLPRARALLLAQGYREPLSDGEPTGAEMWQYNHAIYVEHEASRTLVDLHWRLDEACFLYPPVPREIWQHHGMIPLLGTSVKTLCTEDLFLYLCMHGTRHLWYKLGWICDIATLLRRQPDLLNEALMARVKASGVERMLLTALEVAHQYFGAALPDAIRQRVAADGALRPLFAEVDRGLFQPPRQAHGLIGPYLEKRYFQIKMRERFRDRQALLLDIARTVACPNGRDREAFGLAPWASWLYYGLKPARLLWRHGRMLCKDVLRLTRPT